MPNDERRFRMKQNLDIPFNITLIQRSNFQKDIRRKEDSPNNIIDVIQTLIELYSNFRWTLKSYRGSFNHSFLFVSIVNFVFTI